MPLLNLGNFWKKTALGRTLSGRNKTGQALTAVVNPILIATGLKKATDALGTITGADDAKEIAEAKKIPVADLQLNLTPEQERYVRLGLFVTFAVLYSLGVDVSSVIDAIKEGIEAVKVFIGLGL